MSDYYELLAYKNVLNGPDSTAMDKVMSKTSPWIVDHMAPRIWGGGFSSYSSFTYEDMARLLRALYRGTVSEDYPNKGQRRKIMQRLRKNNVVTYNRTLRKWEIDPWERKQIASNLVYFAEMKEGGKHGAEAIS